MDVMYHLVGEDQSSNNHILRAEVETAKCRYVGAIEDYNAALFDIDQLTALASVDNFLMKYGGTFRISNMEVYANGCINLFIKNRSLNVVAFYVTIRPSTAEKAHYDQLAREHGESD